MATKNPVHDGYQSALADITEVLKGAGLTGILKWIRDNTDDAETRQTALVALEQVKAGVDSLDSTHLVARVLLEG